MTAFRRTLKNVADLADAGLISQARAAELAAVQERYAVAVTPAMAALIDRDDPADPIARQFIPDAREIDRHAGERDDPIGDDLKSPLPGLVHRYPDRVLMKVIGACPVYCRFCFRRETVGPGKSGGMSEDEFAAAVKYIAERPGIWEVILSGGDPLILAPRRVAEIAQTLAAIPHVKILRWHTRVPAVAPERVTDELVAALASTRTTTYVALHANHPRELTAAARDACGRIIDAGIAMVSQTVLLRGINDNVDTLEALMRSFVEIRIKPYYLHHGDLAPGTAHLRTTIEEGQALMRELRARVSGIALPTYVLDSPSAQGKVPIGPSYLTKDSAGFALHDPRGEARAYADFCSESSAR